MNAPSCYFPRATGLFEISHTLNKDEWVLIKEQFPKVVDNPMCPYGGDIQLVQLDAKYYNSVLNVRIAPRNPVTPRHSRLA